MTPTRHPTGALGPGTWRFVGQIAGVGTAEGTRLVVGRWPQSPLGAFADVMVERPDGHRILLAPSPAVASFVTATYRFDEVMLGGVTVDVDGDDPAASLWVVHAGPLRLALTTGPITPLGAALALVPRRLATSPAFSRALDPLARVGLRGVRTAGTAGGRRREYYGATRVRTVVSAVASWAGADLDALRDVHPAVRFGFGSTPRRPSVTDVVTTVVVPDSLPPGRSAS